MVGASVSDGRALYLRECSGCHGPRGDGVAGANLTSVEALANEASGAWRAAVVAGRGAMPAMARARGGPLNDDQVAAVLAYVKLQAQARTAAAPDPRALFDRDCANCHGQDGGRIAAVPLNQAGYWAGRGDDEVRRTLRIGRGGMPAFAAQQGGLLQPAEIDALVAFVRQLGTATQPSTGPNGAELYERACAACHGADGGALPNADLGSKQYLQAQGARQLVEATRDGRGGMPAMGKAKGGQLADKEITAIVDYLLSK
jgi:mono/diheme cytochrome c family protein